MLKGQIIILKKSNVWYKLAWVEDFKSCAGFKQVLKRVITTYVLELRKIQHVLVHYQIYKAIRFCWCSRKHIFVNDSLMYFIDFLHKTLHVPIHCIFRKGLQIWHQWHCEIYYYLLQYKMCKTHGYGKKSNLSSFWLLSSTKFVKYDHVKEIVLRKLELQWNMEQWETNIRVF